MLLQRRRMNAAMWLTRSRTYPVMLRLSTRVRPADDRVVQEQRITLCCLGALWATRCTRTPQSARSRRQPRAERHLDVLVSQQRAVACIDAARLAHEVRPARFPVLTRLTTESVYTFNETALVEYRQQL